MGIFIAGFLAPRFRRCLVNGSRSLGRSRLPDDEGRRHNSRSCSLIKSGRSYMEGPTPSHYVGCYRKNIGTHAHDVLTREPEAAAVHCAYLTDLHKLTASQTFMVVDGGGELAPRLLSHKYFAKHP